MDRKFIEENQIIERYLMGRLSDQERDAFEQFYLDDPETFRELEIAQRFYDALKSLSPTSGN